MCTLYRPRTFIIRAPGHKFVGQLVLMQLAKRGSLETYLGSNSRNGHGRGASYRGTSPIRNCHTLGPYSRTISRALWGSKGLGVFL